MSDRFLPWIWRAVVVLAITGSILIIAEPARSLLNIMFQLKMTLLLVSIVIAAYFQKTVRNKPAFWENPGVNRRRLFAVAASASLSLWICIVICGRLIAYINQE